MNTEEGEQTNTVLSLNGVEKLKENTEQHGDVNSGSRVRRRKTEKESQ